MPTQAKRTENMAKHMTDAELDARAAAEEETIPDRGGQVNLVKPKLMKGDAAAGRYWDSVVERMAGLVILDDLDSDTLGLYCVMMSRYELQAKLFRQAAKVLSKAAKDDDGGAEKVAEAVSKLDAASNRLQSLERNILQYAEKLGLTPSGRVRLAQKRAAQAMEQSADSDLYGD